MNTPNHIEEFESKLRMMENQAKLIDLVEKRTAIWDPRNKNHVNRIVLNTYWKEIGGIIGISGKEASRMWRNLRHEFKIQLDKEKASAKDGDNSKSFESTWPFFKQLLFLKDQGKSQKTESVPPLVCISDDSDNDETVVPTEAAKSPAPNVAKTSPAKKSKTGEDKKSGEDESESREPEIVFRYSLDDDDDICFFNSLLPYVKKLPLNKQFEFRMETQKLLYELTFNTNLYGTVRDTSEEPTATDRIDINSNPN